MDNTMKTRHGYLLRLSLDNMRAEIIDDKNELELEIPVHFSPELSAQLDDFISNIDVDPLMKEVVNDKIHEILDDAFILTSLKSRIRPVK